MDSVFELFNMVIKLTLFSGMVLIGFTYLRSKKYINAKNEFQNLQARLSQLRLALKAKVKRKANVFRGTMKQAVIEGDLYDSTLKSLCDIRFETSEDFQFYFDTSRELVRMIHLANGGENIAKHVSENNFMSNDFKTEMDIIRLIKEMSDLSSRINSRVEEHNRTSNQKLKRIDSLVFASLTEVNRVFKEDDMRAEDVAAQNDDAVKEEKIPGAQQPTDPKGSKKAS